MMMQWSPLHTSPAHQQPVKYANARKILHSDEKIFGCTFLSMKIAAQPPEIESQSLGLNAKY